VAVTPNFFVNAMYQDTRSMFPVQIPFSVSATGKMLDLSRTHLAEMCVFHVSWIISISRTQKQSLRGRMLKIPAACAWVRLDSSVLQHAYE
jgi:hypothetical protein